MSALGIGPELVRDFPFEVIVDPERQDAVVRDIRSAPSLRAARREEEERLRSRRDHPAYRARSNRPMPVVAEPTASAGVQARQVGAFPVIGKIVGYVLALVLVVGVGFGAGSFFQPPAYAGDTWSHVVEVGDTLPGLASLVAADRSTESVMEEIRIMNGLQSDLLVPGQALALPSH